MSNEYWIKFKLGEQLSTHQIVDVSMNPLNDSIHVIEYSAYEQSAQRIAELEAENKKLKINLGTCKNDYWFMINLLEKYSSDKEEAFKDCIERMKFRKPLIEALDNLLKRIDFNGGIGEFKGGPSFVVEPARQTLTEFKKKYPEV